MAQDQGAAPPLPMGLRINLSVMMFFQFAVWGAWFVNLGSYTTAMSFTSSDIGSIFATMSLGAILSPILVGQIADRYFSTEKLMAILHLAGAAILFQLSTIDQARPFYWMALLYALVYSPTLALSNSLAFTHLPDATRDFPGVRVLGTIGWIIAGFLVTLILKTLAINPSDQSGIDAYTLFLGDIRVTLPLFLAALLSLALGLQCFFLPHTPPPGKAGDVFPFLRAVGLMREPSFAVFYGVSFIITIALAFYYAWTSPYLEATQGVQKANTTSIMAIGQVTEMIFLPLLPLFLRYLGMKWVLALGMAAWGVRYGIFSLGSPYALVLVGVALHGICFDFFLAAGFIHVDNESPKEIRASAQALFGFLTYGAGMYVGSELSGYIKQNIYDQPGGTDWTGFWAVPAVGVIISLVIFVAFFHGGMKGPQPHTEDATPSEKEIAPSEND